MHVDRLKKAEKDFLKKYPGGFDHSDFVALIKKHKMPQMLALAKESFGKDAFDDPNALVQSIVKITTRSSMVSMFEKPKLRDALASFSPAQKKKLCAAAFELIHGDEATGFEDYRALLFERKLAKWTLMTVIKAYYKPKRDVFVKPNTTKHVVKYFELDLTYHPKPTWDFYKKYRTTINKMKRQVDPSPSPSNAAFTGFLMSTMN